MGNVLVFIAFVAIVGILVYVFAKKANHVEDDFEHDDFGDFS
jgi:hypothetical protein